MSMLMAVEQLSRPLLAVLIATHNRPALLAERSLPSIARQTRRPDFVVIIDDSDELQRRHNDAIARRSGLGAIYLPNARSHGASGAWNTGLAWLHGNVSNPAETFVAVLDDDDHWEDKHLETCLDAALRQNLDMAVPGIVRHEGADERCQAIPHALDEAAFFPGNPHVQGSNLFVRLSVLLEAGLFDEALPSTTDRDLCLRILDLGGVRIGAVSAHTVHHHAEPNRPRLSTPSSVPKRAGLDGFFRKFGGRMNDEQRGVLIERAARLFHWHPQKLESPPPSHRNTDPTPVQTEMLPLIVGIVVDANRMANAGCLLNDLWKLSRQGFSGLDVILLENGPRLDESRPLDRLAEEMRRQGLRCTVVDLERQQVDAAEGAFGCPFDRGTGRVGIARGRTMIQRYVYVLARRQPGAIAWILDDDKRLNLEETDGSPRAHEPLAAQLAKLRASGAHVVLGQDVDSPLPAASMIRVQLVDLLHNLQWFAALAPLDALPDRRAENLHLESSFTDYFYDLSTSTAHLETPFWLLPARSGETVREAFLRLAGRLPRILAGEQIFRPIHHDDAADVVRSSIPSVHRGGSAFMLDLDTLLVPNPSVDLGAGELRRSDMVWALRNRAQGRLILRAPLYVRHDRTTAVAEGLDLESLARDVQGHALYSALSDVIEGNTTSSAGGRGHGIDRFYLHLEERRRRFDLSVHRVRGLVRSILRLIRGGQQHPWWLEDPEGLEATNHIMSFLSVIDATHAPAKIAAFHESVCAIDRHALRAFFDDPESPTDPDEHSSSGMKAFLERQRHEVALSQVARLCGATDLRLLGSGMEGVSFTDGHCVFKYLDYWKVRASEEQRTFLRSLIGQWPDARKLYPLLRLEEEGCHAVLVYPFEPGVLYRGGHGPELIGLLRECRDRGIVCRNIHPKNLLVAGKRVRLIDYGSDIRPFTEKDFEQMCRRAWLVWRWHHRPDLDALVKRALHQDDLPELVGYERFRRAVETTRQEEILDGLLLDVCLDLRPRRVLDHGCGKGKLARALASNGPDVVGFDPDVELQPLWQTTLPGLRFTAHDDDLQSESPFDLVVSSLVLCTLDDAAYARVLRDVRRLVADNGHVVIAVCNPFFTRGGPTPLQDRHVPDGVDDGDTFVWHKVIAASGRRRSDVHRPWERLRRDLLCAGLLVEQVRMTETVDLERFEPSSDFLVAVLRPIAPGGPKVSLLIRTCAMEWQTIEQQVRHIVQQLETPRPFFERVLVVDSRRDGYLRQYAVANQAAHDTALERLLRAHIVDRIERVPFDRDALSALHVRWFGLSVSNTHTATEVPVSVSLYGFEACRGEYVLHVDSDLLIARRDRMHDFLADMLGVFEADERALSVAFNICQEADRPYTHVGPTGPFRVEVRACLVHRERLLAALPLPNEPQDGWLALSYHRAMDRLLTEGRWRSYRGGDRRTFFIHPQNARKGDTSAWLTVLDRVEDGRVPPLQHGHVDLQGTIAEWLGPTRAEPFVFIVAGRDVSPGRFLRCLESLRRQRGPWSAVLIDDASRSSVREFITQRAAELSDRVTLLRPRIQRGSLANTVWAIRHVCVDPETVILTLDADDALLGNGVVERVALEYAQGADATVGSMLRTDKHAAYPANFTDPRSNRGGNVWQHLRTFRKKLFDAIPDEALRLDGEYVDCASDWAYMLPIIELAEKPAFIPEPMYLYEPSGRRKGAERQAREDVIARILAHQARMKGG